MQTGNVFIAHPTTIDQINALKAVVKAFNVKFEIVKEPILEKEKNNKVELIDNIKPGFKELKLIQERKLKGTTLKEFLHDLYL